LTIDLQVAALILGIIPAKDSGAHIISLYYLHMGFIIILHIMYNQYYILLKPRIALRYNDQEVE